MRFGSLGLGITNKKWHGNGTGIWAKNRLGSWFLGSRMVHKYYRCKSDSYVSNVADKLSKEIILTKVSFQCNAWQV